MAKTATRKILKNWKWILSGLLFVHLFLLFNLKFTAWPEMQLWPYLVLKGWLPYKDIAIAHTPALILGLSLFKLIFGTGLWQLKVYTWLVIIILDLGLFYIARRLWGIRVALASVFFYIFIQTFYEGNGLWFDLALGLYAIGLYYLMRRKYFLMAGMVWAFSFLTKQTAIWFLFPLVFMFLQGETLRKLSLVLIKLRKFIFGVSIVIIPVAVILLVLGIWPDFWHWAIEFGIGILPRAQGQVSLSGFQELAKALLPFMILPFVIAIGKKSKGYQITVWAVFSAAGAYPRWGLFHFQPALPFLAIAVALVFMKIKSLKPLFMFAFAGYLLLISLLIFKFYYREWGRGDRFFEPEVLEVAEYINDKSESGDKILVLNAWDSVYVLSNTLPAVRPWIPHLPWYMEVDGVQEEIVIDLEREKPKFIVLREYSDSGLSSYKPELIDRFLTENYEISDKINNHLILLPKK